MEIYRTLGSCAKQIIFTVKDNKLETCKFINGCSGNGQGIIRLTLGKDLDYIIETLSNIKCKQGTSCPDQLAKALIAYKDKLEKQRIKDEEKAAKLAVAEAATQEEGNSQVKVS